jgi:ABC-type transporter lipoprotein component MlaA
MVIIVFAWDRYYPQVANDQIKGVFHNFEDAMVFVDQLKEEGKFEHVDWDRFEVQ